MKARFIKLLRESDREGMDALIGYLEHETDFFNAPASTKYHGAYEKGLLGHSLTVYDNLIKIVQSWQLCIPTESLIIGALLHDVCKANFYKLGYRNRKNSETNQWEQIAVYEVSDQLPLGHGEKSVMLIQRYIALTPDEMLAIRWHMGGFDQAAAGSGGRTLSLAMSRCSLVAALHMADLAATYFDKK